MQQYHADSIVSSTAPMCPHQATPEDRTVTAVNFTTPADLIAAEAAAAVSAPPAPTAADQAVLNSVAAATNLTRALTDSMSQTLTALGYSPSTGSQPQPLPYACCLRFPSCTPLPAVLTALWASSEARMLSS